MNIWFTADPHFYHKFLITEKLRPFNTIEEMNDIIIQNWNKIVIPNDTVYVLGDFAFANKEKIRQLINKLNGRIILIRGNHDYNHSISFLKEVFDEVYDIKIIKVNNKKIVMCHYPIRLWPERVYGSWHLFGHTHNFNDPQLDPNSLNVGMDNFNFTPINFEQITSIIQPRERIYLLEKEGDEHG